jgi:GH18 family chitinase
MHRVCYITNWSRYRSGEAKFEIEFVDPFMCSHIIYAYATVDDRKPEIIPIQKDDLGSKKNFFQKKNLFLINFF